MNVLMPEEVLKCSACRCRGCRVFCVCVVSPPLSVYSASKIGEDVRRVVVLTVDRDGDRAGAAGLRGDLVAVLVVAEHVGHRDLRAVDRAVLGVGDRDAERHGVAEGRTAAPSPGVSIVTVGAVLPTLICTLAVPVAPCGSRTVSVAV